MPWFHHWSSDNGKWHIFSFTTKFQKINGVLTVVGETVYIPTKPEHFDNPEHPSNHHVPFDETAIKKLPKHVRERAEALWNELNERFVKTSFKVSAEVEYDHQRLMPGELVKRVEEWRKAPEGHYIAKFKTQSGESIPLMMDEVVPADHGEGKE